MIPLYIPVSHVRLQYVYACSLFFQSRYFSLNVFCFCFVKIFISDGSIDLVFSINRLKINFILVVYCIS